MTQDEVDLIYDYLHENYRYEDGELIRTTTKQGANIGDRYGTVTIEREKRIVINCSINIKKKKKIVNLAHMIYIFFHKKKPDFIAYIDGNYANTKIENLLEMSRTEQLLTLLDGRGFYPIKGKNGKIRYHCQFNVEKETISLGVFNNPTDAHNLYLKAKELFLKGTPVTQIKEKLQSGKNDNNKTGLKGVRLIKNKYYGIAQVNKKRIYTSAFNTAQEAHEAYLRAKEELKKS